MTDSILKGIHNLKSWIEPIFKANPDSFLKHVSGVIHVGANTGQERKFYADHNVNVLWLEPIPEVFEKLKENIKEYPNQKAYKYLVTDVDNKKYKFHIANNNGKSSSILTIGLHDDIWPHVRYERSILISSITLDSFVQKESVDMMKYDTLIIDTQGSELLVLKGAEKILNKFKYVKTEVPDFEAYVDCCQVNDISEYLKFKGFKEYSKYLFASRKQGGHYYDIVYKREP
jgi:FkbM family methyltransferase